MKVSVDRERCCSSGMCVLTAPALFDQDEEDGRVILLEAEPPEELHSAARKAVSFCPCQVITVTDD
ncbi:ferredoxin [Sinosporangium siamense]|uniref:Ferredoxin n=1 Tax=Sinosporangium siamense TaxID=1367973 RepID=A0A919RGR1_9ACTN|nr:ferredoxin [Sinosporangium siamense]GII93442.1 ferredoxin [Sinosporangium siamense]